MTPQIIDGTPVIEILIENPLLKKTYPEEGAVAAIIDTGYEGFLLIPGDISNHLGFNQMKTLKRQLILPNGEAIDAEGFYGKITLTQINQSLEGYIETIKNQTGIILGTQAIKNLELTPKLLHQHTRNTTMQTQNITPIKEGQRDQKTNHQTIITAPDHHPPTNKKQQKTINKTKTKRYNIDAGVAQRRSRNTPPRPDS